MIQRVVVIHDTVLTPLHDTVKLVMKDTVRVEGDGIIILMLFALLSFCVYKLAK